MGMWISGRSIRCAAVVIVLAVRSAAGSAFAGTPTADALRQTADRVEAVEQEAQTLRRENVRLRHDLAVARRTQVKAAGAVLPPAANPVAGVNGITTVAAGRVAPAGVHVHAINATLPPGVTPLTARYAWAVVHPDGRRESGVGWNCAFVVDTPGTARVTLTLTTPDGNATTSEQTFRVGEDTRRSVYVASDGDDRFDGSTPERAVRSINRVRRVLDADPNHVRLLLRRGDVYAVDQTFVLRGHDVAIRAWGDPSKPLPTLRWFTPTRPSGGGGGGVPHPFLVEIGSSANGVLIENVRFDAPHPGHSDKSGMPTAIRAAGGRNVVVRGCRFGQIVDAFNGNGKPAGVLISGNVVDDPTSLRGYFVWGAGTDYVVTGNVVANSTREHVVRLSEIERITLAGNRFTNADRRRTSDGGEGDRHDFSKGSITVQLGLWAYVVDNVCPAGPISVGPLGDGDGLKRPQSRWVGAVIEGNTVGETMFVKHGASDVVLRQNRIDVTDGRAIEVQGFHREYARGVAGVTVERNTAVNAGSKGGFLYVTGPAERLTLRENLYVAPGLVTGEYGAASVYVNDADLRAFDAIGGNVWPTGRPHRWARGGVMYVGREMTPEHFLTPQRWSGLANVNADRFEALSLDAPPPLGVGRDTP